MAGRTFYQLANGNLNRAQDVRSHNAEMRKAKKEGRLSVGSPNFGGTAANSKGAITKERAAEIIKSGDIIARKGKDGKVERIKVTAENRDQLLNSNSGQIREQFTPQPAGQKQGDKVARSSVTPFRDGKQLPKRGEKGAAPRVPSLLTPVKSRNKLEAGKPLRSKKQVALRTRQLKKKEKVRRSKEKAAAKRAAKKNKK